MACSVMVHNELQVPGAPMGGTLSATVSSQGSAV